MPNHPRIWSLWDIMNEFDVFGFVFIMHELSVTKLAFIMQEHAGGGLEKPSGTAADKLTRLLDLCRGLFPLEMTECVSAVKAAKAQYQDTLMNVSRAAQVASRLEFDLVEATKNRKFLRIASAMAHLIDRDDLFGNKVLLKFPSATADIKEAGNCLAAECSTACIFHLMRVSEVGLRALARDRDMNFPDKPLELKEWGEILPKLDSIVSDMRRDNTANWGDPQIKEIQVRFYNELSQELRTFNEVWRRHISHARNDAFYDRDYAKNVMAHVEKLMQKLAGKISEHNVTPKYWTENEAKN
jgi:hypothetical protein